MPARIPAVFAVGMLSLLAGCCCPPMAGMCGPFGMRMIPPPPPLPRLPGPAIETIPAAGYVAPCLPALPAQTYSTQPVLQQVVTPRAPRIPRVPRTRRLQRRIYQTTDLHYQPAPEYPACRCERCRNRQRRPWHPLRILNFMFYNDQTCAHQDDCCTEPGCGQEPVCDCCTEPTCAAPPVCAAPPTCAAPPACAVPATCAAPVCDPDPICYKPEPACEVPYLPEPVCAVPTDCACSLPVDCGVAESYSPACNCQHCQAAIKSAPAPTCNCDYCQNRNRLKPVAVPPVSADRNINDVVKPAADLPELDDSMPVLPAPGTEAGVEPINYEYRSGAGKPRITRASSTNQRGVVHQELRIRGHYPPVESQNYHGTRVVSRRIE